MVIIMYQALYRKYRPKTFDDVVGQTTIVKTLRNAVIKERISHAYLFTGPRGTGKTSIAKIFAELVNCENSKNGIQCNNCVSCTQTNNKKNTDIIEMDAASNNSVEDIRGIRDEVNFLPTRAKYRVYIIDEVHMLSTGAFNALLKTLEEPPKHAIFILATTEPHKIPVTILSRCQRYDFERISNDDIVKRLKHISIQEKVDIEQTALEEIALLSDGGMRDSIGMLDQSISYCENRITIEDIDNINGTLTKQKLCDLIASIIEHDLDKSFTLLDIYNKNGLNFYKFAEQLVDFFEGIILYKNAPKYLQTVTNNILIYEQYKNEKNENLINYINILNNTLNQFQSSNNAKLLFELAIIKLVNVNTLEQTKEIGHEVKAESLKQTEVKCVAKPLEKQHCVGNTQIKEYKIKDFPILEKLVSQRINNTLSGFNKKLVMEDTLKVKQIAKYISNSEYGKLIELLIDSKIKASSETNIIFVFDNKNDSLEFNMNIPRIQEAMKKYLHIKKLIVSTYLEVWDDIKDKFNNKKLEYKYDEILIEEETVYKCILESDNEIQELFDECIEYN